MLGSVAEAWDVLAARGVELETKTVRLLASRYAARARLEQQIERTAFADTVVGRRIVLSSEGDACGGESPPGARRPRRGDGVTREPGVHPRC
jgi:hypothetical protein